MGKSDSSDPHVSPDLQAGQARAAALEIIYAALNKSLELLPLLETALTEILRVTGFPTGGVFAWDEGEGIFKLRAQSGWADEVTQCFEMPRSAGAADALEPLFWQASNPLPDQPLTVLCQSGYQTAALLPLDAQELRLGLLVLLDKSAQTLSPDECHLLLQISQFLSMTMRNAYLRAEMAELRASFERQVQELAALHQVSLDVASQLDLDVLLRDLCEHVTRILNVSSAGLYLLEGDELELVITHNLDSRYLGVRIKLDEGLAGRVARSGAPLAIEDYSRWEGRSPKYMPGTFFSVLGVPLIWHGQVIGVLAAFDAQRPHRFTSDELRLLTLFAQQAAVAIQNARAYRAEQKRRRLAETLRDAVGVLGSRLVLSDVLDQVLEQVGQLIPCISTSIALVDEQSWLRIAAARGLDTNVIKRAAWPLVDDPKIQTMLATRQPVIVQDTRRDERWFAVPGVEHIRSWVGAPLMIGSQLLGVLNVDHDQPDFYCTEDIEALAIFAGQVATVIENARLYAEAQRRIKELQGMNEVARAFSARMDLRETTRVVTERVAQVLGVEKSAILLFSSTQDAVALNPAYGLTDEQVARLQFPVGNEPRINFLQDECCLVNDMTDLSPSLRTLFLSVGIYSLTGAKMMVQGRVLGALIAANKVNAASQVNGFTHDDARWLASIAAQAAIALDNARLYKDTAYLKTHYQNIIDSTGAVIYTVDRELRLTSFSAEWDREALKNGLSELTSSRLLGKPLLEFLGSSAQPTWNAICTTILSGGQFEDNGTIHREEVEINAQDGQRIFYLTAGPLQDHAGNIAGIVFVSQDLTAQKDAEQAATQRARYLSALYAVSTAVSQSLDFVSVFGYALPVVTSISEADGIRAFVKHDGKWQLVATDGFETQLVQTECDLPPAVARTVSEGQPVIFPDLLQVESEEHAAWVQWEMAAQAFIPLHARGQTVGILHLGWKQPRAFAERDITLWVAIGRQIGVATVNAQLYADSEVREREARALYEVTRQLTLLDSYHLPENVLPRLHDLVDYDIAGMVVSQGATKLLLYVASPVSQALIEQFEQRLMGEYTSLNSRDMGNDVPERVMWGVPLAQASVEELKAYLVAPLSVGARVLGVIMLASRCKDGYDSAHQRTLMMLANQIAIALENAWLYQTLHERAQALERAYAELQEADRLKDELVQNVSHELRTPLTFIKGYVHLILSGDLGELSPKQREGLEVVARKTDMLTRLVGDIVTLERVKHHGPYTQSVSLAELANLALDTCAATADSLQVTLVREISLALPLVLGDRDQISEVFDNLLSNALKFTQAGGAITIRAYEEGGFVRVEVADTGSGIPADKLDRIFERFYQVDGTARRRFGGAGLGLAIVKRIIEMHGGEVGVTSQLGQGSTFYFTLQVSSD